MLAYLSIVLIIGYYVGWYRNNIVYNARNEAVDIIFAQPNWKEVSPLLILAE